MEVLVIFFWILLSLIVAAFGSRRRIGFWFTLFISILFSPLIGILAVVLSEKSTSGSNAAQYSRKADKALNSNNVEKAIKYLNKSISLNASPTAHYKLATCYSMLKDRPKTFRHLSKAIELGFSDFDMIENDPRLEWIRHQPGYSDFKRNGYVIPTASAKNILAN